MEHEIRAQVDRLFAAGRRAYHDRLAPPDHPGAARERRVQLRELAQPSRLSIGLHHRFAIRVTMTPASERTRTLATYRHANLLVCLMLVIGVSPFLEKLKWTLEGFLLVTLVAGTLAVGARRRTLSLLSALAVLGAVARIAHWSSPDQGVLIFAFLASYMAFFSIVAGLLTRSFLQAPGRADADTICGALSVYLIFGLVWAMAYAALEQISPGSFVFGKEQIDKEEFDRFLGFSFTTLTTLGYGNVAPATPQADALATMEAIIGQFYLAVVIARLVALQLTQGSGSKEQGPEAGA